VTIDCTKDGLRQLKILKESYLLYKKVNQTEGIAVHTEAKRVLWEEGLEKLCQQQTKQIKLLMKENEELKVDNTRMKQQNKFLAMDKYRLKNQLQTSLGITSKSMKSQKKDTETELSKLNHNNKSSTKKKRGAPKGHTGASRKIPEKINETKIISVDQKCNCGGRIEHNGKYDIKYIEDIPPICKIVTKNMYEIGECNKCSVVIRDPKGFIGPPVEIGANLSTQLMLLRQSGVTYRKMTRFCLDALGITLSPSGIVGVIDRSTKLLVPAYDDIQSMLREQNIMHADETGWKVNGQSGYIWAFCNKSLSYFYCNQSRSSEIPKSILGENFSGTLICDYYAGYNFAKKTQRCLVHLLRAIHDERKVLPGSKSLELFEVKLKGIIESGLEIQALAEGNKKDRELKKLERRLDALCNMRISKGRSTVLLNRLKKHKESTLRFVKDPEIEYHNNRAERSIRPLVISRKMSFGTK